MAEAPAFQLGCAAGNQGTDGESAGLPLKEFGFRDLGFRVWFRVEGLGFRVWFRVSGFGFRGLTWRGRGT